MAIVRAAIYLLRASGSRTSVRNVQALVRLASRRGRGMGTDRVMQLMEQVDRDDADFGVRNVLTRDPERFDASDYPEQSRNVSQKSPERFDEEPGTVGLGAPEHLRNAVVENTEKRDTVVEPADAVSTPPIAAVAEALTPPSQPPAQLGLIPDSPEPAKPAKKTRVPNRAEEILSLVWSVAGDVIARSMSQEQWRTKQRRVAKDLAKVGRSDEDILAAHVSASRRFGEACYSLSVVQTELIRLDARRVRTPADEEIDDPDFAEPIVIADVPQHLIYRAEVHGAK